LLFTKSPIRILPPSLSGCEKPKFHRTKVSTNHLFLVALRYLWHCSKLLCSLLNHLFAYYLQLAQDIPPIATIVPFDTILTVFVFVNDYTEIIVCKVFYYCPYLHTYLPSRPYVSNVSRLKDLSSILEKFFLPLFKLFRTIRMIPVDKTAILTP